MKKLLSLLTLAALALMPFAALAQDSTITSRQVYAYAGVPASGTSEVDTITIQSSTSALVFTLTVAGGRTTAPITWSATDATLIARIDAAVEALAAVGAGGVTTAAGTGTSGIGTYTLTFTGKNAKKDMPALTLTEVSRTGGTAATISTTTAGVDATFKDAPAGTLLVNTATPTLYQNTSSTAGSPTWSAVANAEIAAFLAAVPTAAVADLAGTLTGTTDGTLADVAAVSTAGGNTYADSAINTAITAVNLQLKELQVKLNDALAKLRTAGIITP